MQISSFKCKIHAIFKYKFIIFNTKFIIVYSKCKPDGRSETWQVSWM